MKTVQRPLSPHILETYGNPDRSWYSIDSHGERKQATIALLRIQCIGNSLHTDDLLRSYSLTEPPEDNGVRIGELGGG